MDVEEKVQVSNPAEKANYFSKLFFFWVFPFLWKGRKLNVLKLDDLSDVMKDDSAEHLGDRLKEKWDQQLIKAKEKGRKPSVRRAVWGLIGNYYIWDFLVHTINECILKIAQALFLQWLVKSFTYPELYSRDQQYIFAGGLCLTTFLYVIIFHSYSFKSYYLSMKASVALSSLIYQKSLRLSRLALTETNVGQAVNILSNDMSRFQFSLLYLPYLILSPIQLGICGYLLWQEFGVSSLAGIGLTVLLLSYQYLEGKCSATLRAKIAMKSDSRARFMSEIIVAIRVIKMYAWEKPFSELINRLRKLEVRALTQTAYLRSVFLAIFYMSPKAVLTVTIVVFIFISGKTLEADKIFFAVAIFNTLLRILLFALPNGISGMRLLSVSLARIQLLLDEQKCNSKMDISAKLEIQNSLNINKKSIRAPSIQMKSVSASWTSDRQALVNLNLNLSGNQLVMVIGSVGSGKSSFLNTLLAELPIASGECILRGKTSYASQESWVFSGNIRQNIVFGREFNTHRYKNIIKVCALERDLEQWPHGDLTIVGERGITLSGGQKARVSLARAIYQEADIYLLDDPLSAVDTSVSRHIFEKCIKNHLKNKLRVLVTHQLQYLPTADHIILLDNGKILAQGSYASLAEQKIDFLSVLGPQTKKDENIKHEKVENHSTANTNLYSGQIVQPENMTEGGVTFKTYTAYFKSTKSPYATVFILIGFILKQIFLNASDYWLSEWTNKGKTSARQDHHFDQDFYMWVFTGLVIASTVIIILTTVGLFQYCLSATVNMHNVMFKSLIRAPTKFFDQNPSGRIMNRFTKDVTILDEQLPEALSESIQLILQVVGAFVVICLSNYYILLPSVFVLIGFYWTRKFYIGPARSLKRLEALTRSPIFTHLTASLQGLPTIRSSGCQDILIRQFRLLQDSNSSAEFLYIATTRWLGVWLELICISYLTIITISFFFISSSIESGFIGLALSSVLLFNTKLQLGVRQAAEVENNMISVERILEYSNIKPEAPLESKSAKQPSELWPSRGEIKLCGVSISYGEKIVLNKLTFDIKSNEKIGIVGRTGAGKSSIIAALFRLTEPAGQIYIDGLLINELGLHDVRKNISIIPQEPVLFSGTMRYNLDPFNQFKDDELWEVLSDVELKDAVPALDFGVTDGGGNFSVGQRQLVCLARAILRKNKIIVMDEATANVDPKTDEFIQRAIRRKFADCTIITIAHRLESVMDSDRILVLDNGILKEYDHPHVLLQNVEGHLTSMVNQIGEAGRQRMKEIADNAYHNRIETQDSMECQLKPLDDFSK